MSARLPCNNSSNRGLLSSKETVVRNNAKRVALSRSSAGKNASNRSSSHAGRRNRRSAEPVHLRWNEQRGQQDRSSPEVNVSQHQRNRNTSVHRKRRSSNSLSRSAVILEKAKARNHKTVTTDNTD